MTKKINPNLTAEQKLILFEEGTERPGSSELNFEKREGSYHCANCDKKLFDSRAKELGYNFKINSYTDINDINEKVGCLEIMECPDITSGTLNAVNSNYVIKNLDFGIDSCIKNKDFNKLVELHSILHKSCAKYIGS